MIHELTYENQGAFIKGSPISDDIIIAHEILIYMKLNNTNTNMLLVN